MADVDSVLFDGLQPQMFETSEILIENTYRRDNPQSHEGHIAYLHEGLVKGVWNRSAIAPTCSTVASVAGDGHWIGVDSFKFGENLFRYIALVPTIATVVPLAVFRMKVNRQHLTTVLESISTQWCTAVSVASMFRQDLRRRVLLLLFDISRLHPRPEIEVRQQDLADLLAVSRQSLSPVLKQLEAAGLVSLGYNSIVIESPEHLMEQLRA